MASIFLFVFVAIQSGFSERSLIWRSITRLLLLLISILMSSLMCRHIFERHQEGSLRRQNFGRHVFTERGGILLFGEGGFLFLYISRLFSNLFTWWKLGFPVAFEMLIGFKIRKYVWLEADLKRIYLLPRVPKYLEDFFRNFIL